MEKEKNCDYQVVFQSSNGKTVRSMYHKMPTNSQLERWEKIYEDQYSTHPEETFIVVNVFKTKKETLN